MSEEETIPEQFCIGMSTPMTCVFYDPRDSKNILDSLQVSKNSPIFLSQGDHRDLMVEFSSAPILFSRTSMWFMPIEYGSDIPLRLDSRVFLYDGAQSGNYTVYESYAVRGGPPVIRRLLEWSPEDATSDATVFEKRSILRGRANLNGIVMTNSWFEQYPFVVYNKDESGDIKDTAGYYTDLLSQLATNLNFTIKHIPARHGWGARTKNGTWNGLMGKLVSKEIDMSAHFGISLMRQNAVDFCWPTFIKKVTLITSKPSQAKLNVWAYVQIFPISAWAVGISCIVVTSVVFAFASNRPIFQGLAMMLRLFIQIGYELPLHKTAAKLLLFSSALSYYMLFEYFCCDLTARMTSDPLPLNIRSFQDVIDQDYKVVTYGKGLTVFYFKTAPKGSAMRWVYENKMLTDETAISLSFDKLLRMVNDEPKTLLYMMFLSYSNEPRWQNLVGLDIKEYVNTYISIGMQKNSEFAELFDYHIIKMQESGVLNRISHRWTDKADNDYGVVEPAALDIQNVVFLFYCIAFGVFVAANVIIAEWVFKKCLKMENLA